ncbi:MAG: glycosyltransferase [Faecalibacterium sp.]
MQKPLVSIIVPVYNAQQQLPRCLDSIRAQSWKDLEIILLNDGSSDGSLALCQAAQQQDSRIRVVDKENSGVADTRNAGLALAGGKYVQFVDSDDYLDSDYTELLVCAAEENGADLVIAPYRMVIPPDVVARSELAFNRLQEKLRLPEKEHEPRETETREYTFLPPGVMDREMYARQQLEKPATFFYSVVWNKLYRRELLVKDNIRFPGEVRWSEDLIFNMQYVRAAQVFCAIGTAGYNYVQNQQSICHTQINPASVAANRVQVFRYFKKLYEDLGMYDEAKKQLHKFLFSFSESTWPSGTKQKLMEYLGKTTPEDMLETIEKAAAEMDEKEARSRMQGS